MQVILRKNQLMNFL